MSAYEDVIARLGAANDGIVTSDATEKAGVPDHALETLRTRGVLVHVGLGVDRLRDHPPTWRCRLRAAVSLAGPNAVVCLRSAARLHHFYRYRDADEIEVVVLRGRNHRLDHGRLVETRWLPPEHCMVIDGFLVTTPARTFFDLCGDPDHGLSVAHPYHERRMVQVYNDALGRRGMSFTQEAAVLVVMAKRGRAGTVLVRRLLLRFGPKHVPSRSDTETLFLQVVETYELLEPERQAALGDVRGWIGTVDFVWRPARHVVEVDSSWHDGPLDVEEDHERDARLVAAGYTVARYRYGRLIAEPAAVARELAVAIRSMTG